jgi:ABC-type transport system involved in Fe-S cluster assembly fused permease/ATPase subunit
VGGEKQRVALHGNPKNPPILILDEATSALDSNITE